MIPLELAALAGLCAGELDGAPGAERITGVEIDSRRIQPGDLFVAVGRGAGFRSDALARGAAATLLPDDAFAALAALGRAVRERSSARVVGITGSTAKTSTKDILAALLRPHRRTLAAEASFNNELGVPLTLCRLEPDTEVCVLELAMRGLGQIAELCAIARPEIGVITSIGPVHLENLGTVARVAQAKAELVDALPPGGVAIVPGQAPELEPFLTRRDLEIRRFGRGGEATVESFEALEDRSRIAFDLHGRRLELEFNFSARHQAVNALAALLAYEALGLPLEDARVGAGGVELSRWRGDEVPLPGGGLLINDCYNANPVSMRAALAHLAERAGERRRVAVLGDMAELGPGASTYHREIGHLAAQAGVGALVAVGPLARGYVEGARGIPVTRWAPGIDEGLAALEQVLEPGDCVLVKGSRAMGLEAIADLLGCAEKV